MSNCEATSTTNHQDVTENEGISSESTFSSNGTRARRDSAGKGSAAHQHQRPKGKLIRMAPKGIETSATNSRVNSGRVRGHTDKHRDSKGAQHN